MKNTEHTPGPWSVGISTPSEIIDGVAKYGRVMAGETMIAQCIKHYGAGFSIEANAQLIAAAPELLAALECLSRQIIRTEEYEGLANSLKDALLDAEVALAKATGETK